MSTAIQTPWSCPDNNQPRKTTTNRITNETLCRTDVQPFLLGFMKEITPSLHEIGLYLFGFLQKDILTHGAPANQPELIAATFKLFAVSSTQFVIDVEFQYSYIPTTDDLTLERDNRISMMDDFSNR